MSELKVYHHELRHNEYEEFYLKYEADKVIADKDKEIQRLEKLCENYRCNCDNLAIMTDKMRKAGRTLRQKMNHQKYKRCLAMAKYCEAMRGHYLSYEEPKWFWYRKWSERWLELAEKFKEVSK